MKATIAKSTSATIEMSTSASRAQMLGMGSSAVRTDRRSAMRIPPPTARAIISPRNIQPMGDSLKACKLLKIPLRVRKVAKLHNTKVAIASAIAVFFRARRYCQPISAWIKAVPVSQGMSDPFSTGSQLQYPPQPNSS